MFILFYQADDSIEKPNLPGLDHEGTLCSQLSHEAPMRCQSVKDNLH